MTTGATRPANAARGGSVRWPPLASSAGRGRVPPVQDRPGSTSWSLHTTGSGPSERRRDEAWDPGYAWQTAREGADDNRYRLHLLQDRPWGKGRASKTLRRCSRLSTWSFFGAVADLGPVQRLWFSRACEMMGNLPPPGRPL